MRVTGGMRSSESRTCRIWLLRDWNLAAPVNRARVSVVRSRAQVRASGPSTSSSQRYESSSMGMVSVMNFPSSCGQRIYAAPLCGSPCAASHSRDRSWRAEMSFGCGDFWSGRLRPPRVTDRRRWCGGPARTSGVTPLRLTAFRHVACYRYVGAEQRAAPGGWAASSASLVRGGTSSIPCVGVQGKSGSLGWQTRWRTAAVAGAHQPARVASWPCRANAPACRRQPTSLATGFSGCPAEKSPGNESWRLGVLQRDDRDDRGDALPRRQTLPPPGQHREAPGVRRQREGNLG